MRKTNSRIISLILALALVFSMLPLSIFAEGDAVSDGRGTGKYYNSEETLHYDDEANGYHTVPAENFYFEINNPSANSNTITVLELDINMQALSSTNWSTCFYPKNAAGEDIGDQSGRLTLSTIDGKIYISGNYGNTTASSAAASFDPETWVNIRYEIDNETFTRRVFLNNVEVLSESLSRSATADKVASQMYFYSRKDPVTYIDNVYAGTITKSAAPGEGKYANETGTLTYDDSTYGYYESDGSSYTVKPVNSYSNNTNIFVAEFDYRWDTAGVTSDVTNWLYLRDSSGTEITNNIGRFCFGTTDGDLYLITNAGSGESFAINQGEWHNIRLENEFLCAENSTSATKIIQRAYIDGVLVYSKYISTKTAVSVDTLAQIALSYRKTINYDLDNLYCAFVNGGNVKGNGEFADVEGAVTDTVEYANASATVAVPGTDGYVSDEILVFESDVRFNATNYTSATTSKWAGAFSLTDVNGNINTESSRMGIFTDGTKIVLGWNADCDGWALNEDGSVENALAELEFLKWYNVRYVYRHTVNSEGTYDRVVEFYLDGELIASKSDNPATGPVSALPDMTAGFIWNRNSNLSYSVANTYVGALDAKAIANGISYESTDKALAAANNGSTVKVLEALEVGTELTVPGEKNIYVELHAAENAGHLPGLNQNVYTVIENEYFEFLGGSLRYEDAADGSTNIRLGYRFTDKFDFASNNWAWEYTLGSRPSTQLQGSAYNEENRNSNIVFTDVDVANYDKDITVRLGFTVSDGETLYIVFDAARTYTVLGVAEALVASDTASAESKAYAQTIIDAYNAANAE